MGPLMMLLFLISVTPCVNILRILEWFLRNNEDVNPLTFESASARFLENLRTPYMLTDHHFVKHSFASFFIQGTNSEIKERSTAIPFPFIEIFLVSFWLVAVGRSIYCYHMHHHGARGRNRKDCNRFMKSCRQKLLQREVVIFNADLLTSHYSKGAVHVQGCGMNKHCWFSKPQETLKQRPKCAICLVQYKRGDSIVQGMKCKHLFHTECMLKWFSVSLLREKNEEPKCPYCRQRF